MMIVHVKIHMIVAECAAALPMADVATLNVEMATVTVTKPMKHVQKIVTSLVHVKMGKLWTVMALAIATFGCKMFPATPVWEKMAAPWRGKPIIKNYSPPRI